MYCYWRFSDGVAECEDCGRKIRTTSRTLRLRCPTPRPPPPAAAPRQASGAGTELRALLKRWLGFDAEPGCSCRSMATKMDAFGIDWCESESGRAEILGVMQAEHARRAAAGQTLLPWSELAAGQLVRLACRVDRKKAAS